MARSLGILIIQLYEYKKYNLLTIKNGNIFLQINDLYKKSHV